MAILNQQDLRELIDFGPATCVSMFLPTERVGQQWRQNTIRLKNLWSAAQQELLARGLRRPEAEGLLRPVEELLRDVEPVGQSGDGFACFVARDFFRTHSVPLPFDDLLVVNERFYVKPLLPLLHSDGRYYLLALTKDNARLFEATRGSLRELELPQIEMAEVDGADRETLQYHAYQAPSQGRGGKEAMFHGQGGPEDRAKIDTLNYFHRVDRAVRQVLSGQRALLVLACVDYLAPLYRAASRSAGLLESHVSGNPELWSNHELCARGWQAVEPHFQVGQRHALQQWHAQQGNRLASADVSEVVLAAEVGRVETLFVRPDRQQWGRIDSAGQRVELFDHRHDGAEELLDYAAARTLVSGGEVYATPEVPVSESPLAATFRY